MSLRSMCVLAGAVALLTAAGEAKKTAPEPVVWGVTAQNSGCVIFEEGNDWSWMGVKGKTPVLRVLSTVNYHMDQSEWAATPAGMDLLNERAEKDKLKLIRIPQKHSKAEVTRARGMCRAEM